MDTLKCHLVKIHGVAGAVLQTPSQLFHSCHVSRGVTGIYFLTVPLPVLELIHVFWRFRVRF